MFPAPKPNLVGHRLLDDGEVDTVATRRLVTERELMSTWNMNAHATI